MLLLDVFEDQSLQKKLENSQKGLGCKQFSKQAKNIDMGGGSKRAIKLELVPGVEKTSKLESMTSEPQQTKTG